MSTPNAITIKDLNLIYLNGHQALRNVNLELPTATVCALIGMNGSGKSTLFKSILNLEKPTTGTISILDQTVSQAIKANLISYVPQADEIDYDFPLSVYEVIMQGRYAKMNLFRKVRSIDHQMVMEAAKRMQLESLLQRQIGELSGGQKKRVFIARALVQEASLILLDEPFTGVDITTENHIIELLPQLAAEGKTILISTHNLERIKEYCDRTIMLYRTILYYGKTEEVLTPANIKKTFQPHGDLKEQGYMNTSKQEFTSPQPSQSPQTSQPTQPTQPPHQGGQG